MSFATVIENKKINLYIVNLRGRSGSHRVVGMGGPVCVARRDWFFRPLVGFPRRQITHRYAFWNRADGNAQVAAYALIFFHFEEPLSIFGSGDRLVRRVFASNMTATALNAAVLVNDRLRNMVQV